MDYDFDAIKAQWIESERAASSLMASLDAILTRFREGLKTHSDRRERLLESITKVSDRKRETVQALNNVVKKIDKLEKDGASSKQELRLLKMADNVANSKYEEILSGRLPTLQESADNIAQELDEAATPPDLAERKRIFLENVTHAFDELDDKLSQLKERKSELVDQIGSYEKNFKACQLSRGVLARKLEMYRAEINDHEEQLKTAIVSEKDLLAEYHEFIERLKNVVDIPGSVEKILSQTESDLEPTNNVVASGL